MSRFLALNPCLRLISTQFSRKIHNMFHKSLTNLSSLPKSEIKQFIDSFDTVLTDCDGVLWLQNNVLEGSPDALNRLRELGKKIYFVTNNSTKFRQELLEKVQRMGFVSEADEMISTSALAADYLKEKNVKKAYVVGTEGITRELSDVGIESFGIGPDPLQGTLAEFLKEFKKEDNVGAVVVGFDEHISYIKFLKAATYLADDKCLFVATNTDEQFPGSEFILPGTGTFVSAITTCSGRQPLVIGKPNPYIANAIKKKVKLNPERTLMIGDRCNTDIQLGTNCGFQTLLVLTGVTTLKDALNYKKDESTQGFVPDVYLERLGDLCELLD